MRTTLFFACLLLAPAVHAADTPKKPNILLIYADDQSYKTVGCYPESWPWVKTPNIDALAKSGVRFHGAYYEKQILAFNGEENWQDGYPADNYTKWAVDYVKGANRDKDKPWFLWLCYGGVAGAEQGYKSARGKGPDARTGLFRKESERRPPKRPVPGTGIGHCSWIAFVLKTAVRQ